MSVISDAQAAHLARQFGLFLHFNMSTFSGFEQSGNTLDPSLFNPGSTLNVNQWVNTARAMKARYACLTAKHADGFCLWPSALTTRTIASSSWYAANGNQDIVGQFTSKFRAAGIVPLIYFSIADLTFEAANPGFTQAQYLTYLQGQITELLSNYGPIAGLWLDKGEWFFGSAYPWASAADREAFIQGLQPACLDIDNNHLGNLTTSNIVVYEGGSFGAVIPPGNTDAAEMVDTIRSDNQWFWHVEPSAPQTAAALLAKLTTANSRNGTFMINAGPDNTGNIPDDEVAVLTALGQSIAFSWPSPPAAVVPARFRARG